MKSILSGTRISIQRPLQVEEQETSGGTQNKVQSQSSQDLYQQTILPHVHNFHDRQTRDGGRGLAASCPLDLGVGQKSVFRCAKTVEACKHH